MVMTSYNSKNENLQPRIGRELRSKTRPLTNEELYQAVPSMWQVDAHDSRSSYFRPIATFKVIDRLREEGFEPFAAIQSKARDESKTDFTKHQIRLRKRSDMGIILPEWDEIILVNANDGTSSYQLMAGSFRLVCANGLVTGSPNNTQRVYHKGSSIEDDVIEGVFSVVKQFDEVSEYRDAMKGTILDKKEQRAVAISAMAMSGFNLANLPYEPELLLRVNRNSDANSDLWSTFNTVQENMIKGGVRYYNEEKQRYACTRAITNISRNIDTNQAIWAAAKMMIQSESTKQDLLAVV